MLLSVKLLEKKWKASQIVKLKFTQQASAFSKDRGRTELPHTVQAWFFNLYQKGAKIWNEFFEFNIKNKDPICVDFSYFQFLSSVDFSGYLLVGVDFSYCRFQKSVKFDNIKGASVNFFNANFLKDLSFTSSIFENINFTKATFHQQTNFFATHFKTADFSQAKFLKQVKFEKTTFHNPLLFDRKIFAECDLTFSGVSFMQDVIFKNCAFDSIKLLNTAFQKDCYFQESCFYNDVDFFNTKFLGNVSFANSVFQSKTDFYKVVFAKGINFIASKFKKEVSFYEVELTSLKGMNFYQTYFADKNVFQINQSDAMTSFHNVVFKNIPEFDFNVIQDSKFLQFCAVEFVLLNKSTSWLVENNILNKIIQLSLIAETLQDKDLIKKIFDLKKTINTKIQFYFLLQSLSVSWSTSDFNLFIKLLLLPLFVIFWVFQMISWTLKQLFGFIWDYGFSCGRSYLKPMLYLTSLYPLFYFLYSKIGKFGVCTTAETQNFLLSHYIPFSSNFAFFQNIQAKCFQYTQNLSVFYLSFLQTVLSVTLLILTMIALYNRFFVLITKYKLWHSTNLSQTKNLAPLQLTTSIEAESQKTQNTKTTSIEAESQKTQNTKTNNASIVLSASQKTPKETEPMLDSKQKITKQPVSPTIQADCNIFLERKRKATQAVVRNLRNTQNNQNQAIDSRAPMDQQGITALQQRIEKYIKNISPQPSTKKFSTNWPFTQISGANTVSSSDSLQQNAPALSKQADKNQENLSSSSTQASLIDKNIATENKQQKNTDLKEQEVVKQTPDNKQAITNTPDNKQAIANTPDNKQALTNTPDNKQAMTNTPDNKQAMTNTPDNKQAMTNTPDNKQAMTNTPDNKQAMTNTPDNKQAMTNTPDNKQAMTNTPDNKQAMTNTPDNKQAMTNIFDLDEC